MQVDDRSALPIVPNEFPASDGFSASNMGGIPILKPTTMSQPRRHIWILIAESNAVNLIASKNIERMGFSCTVASNHIKALEEVKKRDYDLVLMDCQMPDFDGSEATRKIRIPTNEDVRSSPVIALTASAIKGDRERALEAGVVDYLAKPVKKPALESAVCKWLFYHDTRQTPSRFSIKSLICTPSRKRWLDLPNRK